MIGSGKAIGYGSPEVCMGDNHAYPKIYAGSPEYAAEFFSKCNCGKKRKITSVTEVDAPGFGSEVSEPGEHPSVSEASQNQPRKDGQDEPAN